MNESESLMKDADIYLVDLIYSTASDKRHSVVFVNGAMYS